MKLPELLLTAAPLLVAVLFAWKGRRDLAAVFFVLTLAWVLILSWPRSEGEKRRHGS